jgi:hypothetical protein
MYEHLSNENIKQIVFDYILPIYFVKHTSVIHNRKEVTDVY